MKTTFTLHYPLHQLFKAFMLCALIWFSGDLKAQKQNPGAGLSGPAVEQAVSGHHETLQANTCFAPVYFNYRRRQLMYNGKRLDGASFLGMCRSIGDSAVQEQLARYDDFTAQKQKLSFGMISGGVAGLASFGGSLSTSAGQPEASIMLAFTAVICVVAVPAMGIYSTVPHQKRKAVLFRDLPIAYNAYVEALNAERVCE